MWPLPCTCLPDVSSPHVRLTHTPQCCDAGSSLLFKGKCSRGCGSSQSSFELHMKHLQWSPLDSTVISCISRLPPASRAIRDEAEACWITSSYPAAERLDIFMDREIVQRRHCLAFCFAPSGGIYGACAETTGAEGIEPLVKWVDDFLPYSQGRLVTPRQKVPGWTPPR